MPELEVSAAILGALLLPLLLAILARERALHAGGEVAGRWFAFASRVGTLAQLTPVAWLLTALQVFPHVPALFAPLRVFDPLGSMITFVAFLAPAAIISTLLSLVVHDVSCRLGTTGFTWGETIRRGAWLVAAAVLPAALLAVATVSLARQEIFAGLAAFALAIAAGIVCLSRHYRGFGLTPHAITHGPLRDRLFELAARAGVPLQQLYILPMKRMHAANAFAVTGERVMITDLLLEQLDRDEIDAILAHELAHLRRGDVRRLMLARLGFGVVPFLALIGIGWPWAVAGLWLGLVASTAVSRRVERAADREALRLGADGAAFISGLAKLARVGHVPLRWSRWTGWFLTHPSIENRAAVIARGAHIDPAEVSRLLGGSRAAGGHYAVPPGIENGGRLFSTTFKSEVMVRISRLWMFTAALAPAACFALGRLLGLGPAWRAPLTMLAVFLAPAACLGVINFAAVQPLLGLKRKLAARLGIDSDPAADGWRFVGISPHAEPRLYEGFANWELGFARVRGGAFECVTEDLRFTLGPERVAEMSLVPGAPSWIRTRVVRMGWRDDANQMRWLRLTPLGGQGVHAIAPGARRWLAELVTWRGRGVAAAGPRESREMLPPAGEVTCTHPHRVARWGMLVPFAVMDLLAAGFLCVAFGLPIFPASGAGFTEVVLAALAAQLVLMLPAWRYRDPEERGDAARTGERRAA